MRRHPRRTTTNPTDPNAWATSDRGGWVGDHNRLWWQEDYAGGGLVNKGILVYRDELDKPQRQLSTVYLPIDPGAVMDARPEQYDIDEQPVSTRYTMDGRIRTVFGRGSANVIERIISVQGNLRP